MCDYRHIDVYFDSNKNLVAVPCGRDTRAGEYGTASLDISFVLESGYNDDELELFITDTMNACYSKPYVAEAPTAIQIHTGAKSYSAAVRGYQYLSISWLKDKGYTLTPMQADKKHKGAFVGIKGVTINVSLYNKHIPIEKGALALAFKHAMAIILVPH